MGGQFLSCFQSENKSNVATVNGPLPIPVETAFAIRLAGDSYTTADVDKFQATVTAQWKDFRPLGKEVRKDYIAQLNALIKGSGGPSVSFTSVKPVLVSITRLDANSYSVVSIRSYAFNTGGGQISMTKVNADAIVLRARSLIRLTMQRMLTRASDVADLQAEVADWARATEASTP
jgi:hypothetical protein